MNKKHNIILVDDHPVILDGMVKILSELDTINIIKAVTSAKEVLHYLPIFEIDLVITDIEMPDMSGVDLIKKIKTEFPATKVLALSMYNEAALAKKLMLLQVEGYVLKTADKQEILYAVTTVLNGKKHISSGLTDTFINTEIVTHQNLQLLNDLTQREVEILKLIAQGFSNKQIGEQLFISHKTVDSHRTNIMTKLDIHNIAGITRFAIQNKLI